MTMIARRARPRSTKKIRMQKQPAGNTTEHQPGGATRDRGMTERIPMKERVHPTRTRAVAPAGLPRKRSPGLRPRPRLRESPGDPAGQSTRTGSLPDIAVVGRQGPAETRMETRPGRRNRAAATRTVVHPVRPRSRGSLADGRCGICFARLIPANDLGLDLVHDLVDLLSAGRQFLLVIPEGRDDFLDLGLVQFR
jgi:hypothetical protein